MPDTVLVGSTGFVGGNLLAAYPFDAAYHSTDVQNGFGRDNGLVVYAGVPAAMYLANADPAADLAVMAAARENLRRLAPKKVVLISSICVFADSRGKTEADEPTPEGLAPYGANRLQLERWVREDWPDALIVRLPALYGKGLKKNFLYDLHTITPALLRPDKYRQLAAESELVRIGYEDAGNGFYKLSGKASRGTPPSATRPRCGPGLPPRPSTPWPLPTAGRSTSSTTWPGCGAISRQPWMRICGCCIWPPRP